jgi:hypothetical protein
MTHAVSHSLHIVARVTAAIIGGYIFTWGCVALGVTGTVALGMQYEEARIAIMLTAFLIFLTAFLWSFAATSVARVWLVLGLGGATMTALASWLQGWLVG